MRKNYIGLWMILAVSFVSVIIYSCYDPIEIWGLELRSSGIAERLTQDVDSISEEKQDSTVRFVQAPIDTTSHNILIFGDSMLEGLNPRLAAYAKENGHELNSVIWYSSTSEQWGSCDTLAVFLKRFKPTFIFISLGGNELFVKDIAKKRDKWVKSLLKQIGGIPYIWIGPPNWKPDTGINDLIESNVPKGQFFLSNGMHFDRAKDGAHPTRTSAALWMDSIARWMPLHAAHPIKMKKPAENVTARPKSVVVLQPKR